PRGARTRVGRGVSVLSGDASPDRRDGERRLGARGAHVRVPRCSFGRRGRRPTPPTARTSPAARRSIEGSRVTSVAVLAHRGKTLGGGLGELRSALSNAGFDAPLWYEVSKSKQAPKKV